MDAAWEQGLYDLVTTEVLQEALAELSFKAHPEPLDLSFSHERLAEALAKSLSVLLTRVKGEGQQKICAQAEAVNDILRYAQRRLSPDEPAEVLATPPSILRALLPAGQTPLLPAVGLSQPWLFTASKDSPALLHELRAELASCNRLDILVSFITVSGVRKIIDLLKQITSINAQGSSQAKIRVLTTTYIGATEQAALDMLARLPHCQVRVSLDGRRTRLHAKAWIFERNTGFGSSYVGSANLSGAALMGGLEWTVKFTEQGQNKLFQRAKAHFETLWQDGEFQHYDPEDAAHRQALSKALKRESGQPLLATATFFDIAPKPFQYDILDQLENERSHGRMRNLLVAATGTGKTVMAAFDYQRQAKRVGGVPRLLYVAHRKEILQHARRTFCQVLRDPEFGELLTGDHQAENYDHLFTTINSLNSRELVDQLGQDYWHMVVVDECHHIEANSFSRLLSTVSPSILLGLTATPERADGKDIMRHFDNRPDGSPAAQLRLWQALDLQLLTPFEYYACYDGIDYRAIPWRQANELQELDKLLTGNAERAKAIIVSWQQLVADPRCSRTLVFCVSIPHAQYMAAQFERAGIVSKVLTGGSSAQERHDVPKQLERGEIHAIVTVDLYNEGVDLPFVDTLLLLRPTQSVTLFQQQIGRGLRLSEGKESCLIVDFVGQYQAGFRFDLLYSAITGLGRREVIKGLEEGFAKLPSGCHIQLHKQAREHILSSLKEAVRQNWKRLQQELKSHVSLTGKRDVELSDFITEQQLELEDIYRGGVNSGWTNLKREVGLLNALPANEESYFSRRMEALSHIDDSDQLQLLQRVGEQGGNFRVTNQEQRQRIQMLAYQIDGQHTAVGSAEKFLSRLAEVPPVCEELAQLCRYLDARVQSQHSPIPGLEDTPLKMHCAYHSREILTAVGFLSESKRMPFRAGVLPISDIKTEILFVTLDKSSALHEGVAYDDYAISRSQFHWQTQNSCAPNTPSGRRYIDSDKNGWRFQLFVRENKGSPYRACGPLKFLESHGSKPMNITWELECLLPFWLFERLSVLGSC